MKNEHNQKAVQGTGTLQWLIRLLILIAVTAICLIAALIIMLFWQDSQFEGIEGYIGNPAGLNPIERLYLRGYLAARSAELENPVGSGKAPVTFVIDPGQHAEQITQNLVDSSLLRDADLFRNYIKHMQNRNIFRILGINDLLDIFP